jgi:membrane-associated protein
MWESHAILRQAQDDPVQSFLSSPITEKILESISTIFNPESLLSFGGILIMFLIVFAQTGIFFCFFLPSGALLFTAGVWVATGSLHYSVLTICLILILASFAGNITGYLFGRKAGAFLYRRKDSAFFKQEHLRVASSFYEKYGGVALAAGLFFPIIRTFAPVVSGMIKLDLRRFLLFTFIGSVLWILSFVLAGYLIGKIPFLRAYLPYVIIIIIVLVTVPIVIRIMKQFKKAKIDNNGKAGKE